MENFVFYLVKIIHIISSSIWFGSNLLFGRDVLRTVSKGREHIIEMTERGKSHEKFGLPVGIISFVTGFCLIIIHGIDYTSIYIKISIIITFILLILEGALIFPYWKKIIKLVQNKSALDDVIKLSFKINLIINISNSLKFIVIILMVIDK